MKKIQYVHLKIKYYEVNFSTEIRKKIREIQSYVHYGQVS